MLVSLICLTFTRKNYLSKSLDKKFVIAGKIVLSWARNMARSLIYSLLKTRLDHLTLKSIDNLRNCSSYTESMWSGKIGTKYSP